MEIKGCTAVVTGGASGLGEATVKRLVEDGAKAAILDLQEDRGLRIASELGDAVIFCKTDITDEKSVQEAIDKTMDSFGAIHFAINCAGVAFPAKVLSKRGPIAIEQFNQVVQINLVGTMIVIKLAAEKMVRFISLTPPLSKEACSSLYRLPPPGSRRQPRTLEQGMSNVPPYPDRSPLLPRTGCLPLPARRCRNKPGQGSTL